MGEEQLKEQVKGFWEQGPCGSWFATSTKCTREYFDEIEEHRYRVEPFIHQFAQFTRQRGKKVLEVGVGAGTDHLQRLFRQYKDVTITPVLTTYDTEPFPASCTNYLPQAWGWFLVAQGVK